MFSSSIDPQASPPDASQWTSQGRFLLPAGESRGKKFGYLAQIRGRDAGSGVLDLEDRGVVLTVYADIYASGLRCEPERFVE